MSTKRSYFPKMDFGGGQKWYSIWKVSFTYIFIPFYTKNPVAIFCIYKVMGAKKKKKKNSEQTYALWEPVTLTVFIVWG